MKLRQVEMLFVVLSDQSVLTSEKVRGLGPPTASFNPSATSAKRNVSITLSSNSTDPDGGGDIKVHRWDLDGNGTLETNTGAVASASTSFSTPGSKNVRLQVTDADGESSGIAIRTLTIKSPPRASFTYSPGTVRVGDRVSFRSTSTDPDGDSISSYSWDLDGNGSFGDSTASTPSYVYTKAGTYTVSLRVLADGETTTAFQTITVGPQPVVEPPDGGSGTAKPTKLNPFPVVVIAGVFTGGGVKVSRLVVRAPRGSKVTVVCKGGDCPRRVQRRTVGKSGRVRLRSFQRRLRAGTVLRITVRKKGKIGKYTRFKIARGRPPARVDRCVLPGKRKPVRCSKV
jgi:PKD repeat protein